MPGRFDLATTTLEQLLADPESRAILDELAPGLAEHPMLGFVKAMPAEQVLALAGGQLDPAVVAQLKERIGKL